MERYALVWIASMQSNNAIAAILGDKPTMNPYLRDFWETQARYKVLYGGRSSSKTWDAAAHAVRLSSNIKLKFMCVRQFQANIRESVYTIIIDTIERYNLTHEYHITDSTITHKITGSTFIFKGLWRNIDEVKSTEGIDVLWIEEAHNLKEEQFEVLDPTIRKQGSEVWVIFNPGSRIDFSWKHFVEEPLENSIVRKINYTENPFLSETMLKVIAAAKEKDPEKFEHIYLGYPNEGSETALFTYKDIDRAMNRNASSSGATVVGCDVARYGDDSTVLVVRSGLWVKSILQKRKLSITETADWTSTIANISGADAVVVDTIGIGAGVHDILIRQGVFSVDGNFGMKAAQDNTYYNKRAESYFKLADAVKRGLALPKDDDLAAELLAIEYKFMENGKVRIESKDKIKENLGRSPDKADALALTYFTDVFSRKDDSFLQDFVAPNVF